MFDNIKEISYSEEIIKLYKESFIHYEGMSEWLNGCINLGYISNEKLLGAASFKRINVSNIILIYVVMFAVDWNHREKKIGKSIMTVIKQIYGNKIILWSDERVCGFYKKQSFGESVNLGKALMRKTNPTTRSRFMYYGLEYDEKLTLMGELSKNKFKIALTTPEEQKILIDSLNNALKKQNMKFNDDLVGDVIIENYEKIQKLSKLNEAIYKEFKLKSRQGIYGPLEVFYDNVIGYGVRAINDIEENTLISEYAGEILKYDPKSTNDSLMKYIADYVIQPTSFGNIAKYVSGINDSKKSEIKKANVRSIRCLIEGRIHVLLYTIKKIKKGNILKYNYNGEDNEYNTSRFVSI
jgi:hypothetical protein